MADAVSGDRIVCIKFFAVWCRACKAMGPKYQRIANEWEDDVEFYEIACAPPRAALCGTRLVRPCATPVQHDISRPWTPICICRFTKDTSALFKQKGLKVMPVMEMVAGSQGPMEPFVCGPSKIDRLRTNLAAAVECAASDQSALPEPELPSESDRPPHPPRWTKGVPKAKRASGKSEHPGRKPDVAEGSDDGTLRGTGGGI